MLLFLVVFVKEGHLLQFHLETIPGAREKERNCDKIKGAEFPLFQLSSGFRTIGGGSCRKTKREDEEEWFRAMN